jgi:ABC-type multidrug transport system ATPase subunit
MPDFSDLAKPIALEARGLGVRFPRQSRPVLAGLDLEVAAGTVIGITGESGSGKTTLLHVVAGLIPWMTRAAVQGEISIGRASVNELDPGQRAHSIATCLDRPESQLFLEGVRNEVEHARIRHGPGELANTIVDRLGVTELMDRRISELSSGERQRVALATALLAAPKPILLDEPCAHLDTDGEAALTEILSAIAIAGGSVMLTEQAGWRVSDGVTRWSRIRDGRAEPVAPPTRPPVSPPDHEPGDAVVLEARGLTVSRGRRRLVRGSDLVLREGEIVALTGPNGSGKSTLAQVLAGLRKTESGSVRASGRVALMLPETDLQLFAQTVAAEVSGAGDRHEERSRVLRRHRLEHLAARAPWTLSRGERQRLVHASLDLLRPSVLIVDEPGQGLDGDDLAGFLRLIRWRAAKGRSYLVITHRPELTEAAHRRIAIRDGRLEEVAR